MLLAIDPGSEESAWLLFDAEGIRAFGKEPNAACLERVARLASAEPVFERAHACAIEMIASYGMPVGAEVFETCVWVGRFMQVFGAGRVSRITRNAVKHHLCHSSKAKDANIRQALIDRYGGKSAIKKGGALYGIHEDVWAALAVAVTWWDREHPDQEPF
jgi:hypothetical protein